MLLCAHFQVVCVCVFVCVASKGVDEDVRHLRASLFAVMIAMLIHSPKLRGLAWIPHAGAFLVQWCLVSCIGLRSACRRRIERIGVYAGLAQASDEDGKC